MKNKREQAGDLFVIRPERELSVARVEKNPEKLKEAYEIGRKTALSRMNAIRQYLGH